MATMTIRGIDDEVAKLLKERAKSEGIRINGLIIENNQRVSWNGKKEENESIS